MSIPYSDIIFPLIGGIGLFFFGMQTMSDGLKKIAGEGLKNILNYVTRHRVVGVLAGAFITILIQSSSATTIMVVGFVNAGLLALKQAITVIMGANIGTTFTAWLVSSMSVFKITKYALPLISIGFGMKTLCRSQKRQDWGQILLGFGILFVGLSFMKDSFDPLKESQALKDVFITFSDNPLLGVLVGIVFTVLLQSSSATIAITQVLAFNGLITFEAAIPIILGDNIGTTITAQLAAIGTNLNARRAAMSHTIFNVLGVGYMLIFVYTGLFKMLVDIIIPGEINLVNVMFHIAVAHSTFNVINTLVFLPFVGLLEKASILLVRQKGDMEDIAPQYLETHLLDTPSLALEQVHKENIYMLSVAKKAATHAMESFLEDDLKKVNKVSEYETATDNLQSAITQYIIEISQRNLSENQSEEIPVLIHNVNDLERIGDHSQNMSELAKRKIREELPFTNSAIKEIQLMWGQIEMMFEEAEIALKDNNVDIAKELLVREKKVNDLQNEFKESHITRLNDGQCQIKAGFIFLEYIDNLEKIGDRLTNIAQSVIGKMKWELQKKAEASVSDPA